MTAHASHFVESMSLSDVLNATTRHRDIGVSRFNRARTATPIRTTDGWERSATTATKKPVGTNSAKYARTILALDSAAVIVALAATDVMMLD